MLNAPTTAYHGNRALFLAVIMALTVGTALGFEHIGGYIPCKLCLEQRDPYYFGVPLMLLAAAGGYRGWAPCVTRGLLAIGGLLMTYGLLLAIFHSGVEWGWWAGPADCAAAATAPQTSAGNLLSAIDEIVPPSCDKAAGRFLGLSFAGWNVLASLFLAAIAFQAAFSSGRE